MLTWLPHLLRIYKEITVGFMIEIRHLELTSMRRLSIGLQGGVMLFYLYVLMEVIFPLGKDDLPPKNWSSYNVSKIRTGKGDTWLKRDILRNKSSVN